MKQTHLVPEKLKIQLLETSYRKILSKQTEKEIR